jgi:hypothetical protein
VGGHPQQASSAHGAEVAAGGLGLRPPYVPLAGLTRWATGCLALAGALSAVSLGVELSQLRLLLQPVGGESARALARAAQEATGSTVGAVRFVLFAVTATLFLAWIYHARANVRAFGVRRPRFTRGWAVGAFLVPGINLVRPYAVLAEIWQASDPAILDPFDWRDIRVPRLVRLWWAATLAWIVVTGLAALADATAGVVLGRLRLAAVLAVVADAGACAAAAFGWILIVRLAEVQDAKWQRVRPAGAAAGAQEGSAL